MFFLHARFCCTFRHPPKAFAQMQNFFICRTCANPVAVTVADVLQIFYELQVKWNVNLLQLPFLCELFPWLFLTAQHLSPLLVLAFTIDRYVSVCHPFEQERFCSRRWPLATICVLTAIALGINAVQAYFWTYNIDTGDCGLRLEVCYSCYTITLSLLLNLYLLWQTSYTT